MKPFGMVIALLLVAVVANAQTSTPLTTDAEREQQAARAELNERLRSFQALLPNTPVEDPAQHVKMVDEWLIQQQHSLERVRAADKKLAQVVSAQAEPQTVPTIIERDPLLADIRATDMEVAAMLLDLRKMKVSPAQQIHDIDQFLALNIEVFAEQDERYFQLATKRDAGQSVPPSAPATRIDQISLEIRQLFEGVRDLSPKAQITELDVKEKVLRRLLEEQKTLQLAP